jgi:hypothetical protein
MVFWMGIWGLRSSGCGESEEIWKPWHGEAESERVALMCVRVLLL